MAALLALGAVLIVAHASARAEDVWVLRVPIGPASPALASPDVRQAAARALLASEMRDLGSAEPLVVAWLAMKEEALQIREDPESRELIVTCDRPSTVREDVRSLLALTAAFGTPIVAIEPERPSSPDDRKASGGLQSALAQAGIRTLDGAAVRESRRAVVDSAVERGLDGDAGRAALDHLDADYLVRIESRQDPPRVEPVYGVDLHVAERHMTITLMRSQTDSVVRSWQHMAQGRSRSSQIALQDSEANAIPSVAVTVLAAIADEWIALAKGARPWIVEIHHPDQRISKALASGASGSIKVLEHRPGVRAVIEVAEPEVPQLDGLLGLGPELRRRPGVILVTADGRWPAWAWILVGGLGAIAASAACAALVARKRHAGSRASPLS